jgi:hypothetical protein
LSGESPSEAAKAAAFTPSWTTEPKAFVRTGTRFVQQIDSGGIGKIQRCGRSTREVRLNWLKQPTEKDLHIAGRDTLQWMGRILLIDQPGKGKKDFLSFNHFSRYGHIKILKPNSSQNVLKYVKKFIYIISKNAA